MIWRLEEVHWQCSGAPQTGCHQTKWTSVKQTNDVVSPTPLCIIAHIVNEQNFADASGWVPATVGSHSPHAYVLIRKVFQ